MDDNKEWHKIGDRLTQYFGICSCQRKLRTIILNLASIKDKLVNQDYDFTVAEWLLLAMMETFDDAVCHGINCEYPIIDEENSFWIWIEEMRHSPYLKDN